MDAVIIRLIDMPVTVRGITVKDSNDDYNIFLNARLSAEMRVIALRHEVDHIRSGHFYDYRSVAEKELATRLRETLRSGASQQDITA